jgi:Zn-dependent protease with chaperone function
MQRQQQELDAQLLADITRQNPAAVEIWKQAIAATEHNDLAQADVLYARVHELLPRFSPALRRRGRVLLDKGDRASAIRLCREARAIEDTPDNAAALALALVPPEKEKQGIPAQDIAEALMLAQGAAASAPDNYFAQIIFCQLAFSQQRIDLLDACSARLEQIDPADSAGPLFATIAAASRGRWSDAREALGRARARGLAAATADDLAAQIEAAEPTGDKLLDGFLRWGGRLGLAWLCCLVFFMGSGTLLSALALRAASRLPREASGRPVGAEAALRKVYALVLWLCSAFYYLSIPLMLALVVAFGGGIIYACFALGRIPIKLVLLVGLLLFSTIGAVLRSLWVRGTDAAPGERLDLAAHPRLRTVLDEVAAKIRTRAVDNVYLTPSTDLAVTERGTSLWQQLSRRPTERCLILGAGVLDGMRLLDFQSILAHEYGHFQNRDTAGGGFALAVRRSLVTMMVHLAQGGVAVWWNPAWWFVRSFFWLFFRISQGASRLQEILCDRWAAFAYGSENFEHGLQHVIAQGARFDAYAGASLNEVLEKERPLRNLYDYRPEQPPAAADVEEAIAKTLAHEPSAYDSHPSPKDRLRLVRALAAPGPVSDGAMAWDLFADRAAIEQAMTDVVRGRVESSRGVLIPREAAVPEPAATAADGA